MTTYNTGNPVGSVEVKDLYDNAQNLDRLVNDRTITSYPDRLGVPRKSWYGMEQDFNAFLANSQFEYPPLTYVDGTPLTVNRPTQLIQRSGQLYRVRLPATFPVNLTGTWATDAPLLTAMSDASLRQDLASPASGLGASIISRANQVVNSIAALRALLKSSASQHAFVTGYYAALDGGGGMYWLDSADSTTADNGGSVIVATDGGRWKLAPSASYSIRQFGAAPSQTGAVNRAAILATIAAVQAQGGGAVRAPGGTYAVSANIDLNPIAGIGFHNIEIIGDGPSTIFDFTSATAGTDGIGIIGWGGRILLRDFTIKGAKASGININKGEIRTGPSWISRFSIERVIVDGAATFGFNAVQAYMGSFVDCEARNCGSHGFNMQGFHTSLHFKRCWSGGDAVSPNGGNVGSGWNLNGLIYSSFDACSADQNGGAGWVISNVAATAFRSCGSESNGQEGFLVRTANTAVSGIPSVAVGVNEVLFDSCIGVTNSRLSPNVYANFMGIVTANAIQASVRLRGCTESADANSSVALVANGVSAPVFINEEGDLFTGSFTGSGTVSRQNNTILGRTSLAQLSADQSIPNNTDTAVAFATLYTNRLIATLVSNAIIIPKGVSRVKVTAGVYWNTSSAGVRQIRFVKNGVGVPGLPQMKVAGNGFTPMHLTSATIEVVQGDTIGVVAFQDSGAALNIINNGSTFLSVEAAG